MYIIERERDRKNSTQQYVEWQSNKNNNVCLVLVVNKQSRGVMRGEQDVKCDITGSAIKLYVFKQQKKKFAGDIQLKIHSNVAFNSSHSPKQSTIFPQLFFLLPNIKI